VLRISSNALRIETESPEVKRLIFVGVCGRPKKPKKQPCKKSLFPEDLEWIARPNAKKRKGKKKNYLGFAVKRL
jgi:hypothetical protein